MSYVQTTSLFAFIILLLCTQSKLSATKGINLLLGQLIIQDVWGEPPSPIEGWTTVPAGTPTSICNGQTIIGGYIWFGANSYAEKTYSGLPAHDAVSIQFDVYFMDTWDGDFFRLTVDGVIKYSQYHFLPSDGGATNVCGRAADSDLVTTATTGSFAHSSTSIQLLFRAYLDEDGENESWGFKNIKITVNVICTSACATCFGNGISECYSCNDGWYLSGTTCVTDCPTGKWKNPSGNICESKFFNYTAFFFTCSFNPL